MHNERIIGVIEITPRYAETDQMGFIHHSNHIIWFEAARMQLFNDLGISVSKLEEEGVLLPILSVEAKYVSPIHFNENIIVHAKLAAKTKSRVTIRYVIERDSQILCTGLTEQVCIRSIDKKPIPIPAHVYECLLIDAK